MTLTKKDKKILSDVRMQRATEFLEDARATLEDGRIKTSVNRSYYAALNAIRSLLILDGVNPVSHDGAITLLSLRFVKTKQLSTDLIKTFKSLLSRRTDVDYGDFVSVELSDAEESLSQADEIIEVIDSLRKKLIKEL
jgi:uncharacterized protein (UPF0332 family)